MVIDGKKLQDAMDLFGINNSELAEEIEVSSMFIGHLIREDRSARDKTIYTIADILDIDVNEIIKL